jgi:hypothetical protein
MRSPDQKPLKRFPYHSQPSVAGLKPGVNDSGSEFVSSEAFRHSSIGNLRNPASVETASWWSLGLTRLHLCALSSLHEHYLFIARDLRKERKDAKPQRKTAK